MTISRLPSPLSQDKTTSSAKSQLVLICGLVLGAMSFSTAGLAQDPGQVRFLLKAVNQATLSAQIAAKIEKLPFREGDRFDKGEVLVGFDCRVLKAHLNVARAVLKGERKALENKKKLQKLQSAGALEVALAEAAVEKAAGELSATRYTLEQCVIKAPFSGRVVARDVNRFETVAPGDPLLSILDDRNLELELVIPSHWLPRLKAGHEFQVTIDETGTQYPAELLRLGAQVDPISQTTNAYAKILNEPDLSGLVAGMSGTAVFTFPGQ